MIKAAVVISQKPSAAKKGMYIATLDDGLGELKSYTSRKLEEGQEVLISLQQGAANDPLRVTVFSKMQESHYKRANAPAED